MDVFDGNVNTVKRKVSEQMEGSLLHPSVAKKHVSEATFAQVRDFIRIHPDSVNEVDENMRTPLHLAVANKNERMVELLLQEGADPNKAEKSRKYTPLFEAVTAHSEKCLDLLLKAGADVDARDAHNNTALHLAVRQTTSMVEALVSSGASPMRLNAKNGRAPIHTAAELGAVDILELFLRHYPDAVSLRDKRDMTPLHFAAEKGQRQCCEVLLSHGADPMARSRQRETALHMAVRNCYLLTCQQLLAHTHDINAKDHNGFTPLIRITSCKKFDAENLMRLILDFHPDLDATCPNGDTALHHAAKNGCQEKCHILVEAGADCNVRNKHGMTPLHIAAKKRLPECCAAILRISYDEITFSGHSSDGANNSVNLEVDTDWRRVSTASSSSSCSNATTTAAAMHRVDVNIKDHEDKAPLHYALEKQSVECCLLLIKARATISLMSQGKNTPLHLAAGAGMEQVCCRLLAKGAQVRAENEAKETPLHLAARAASLACCRLLFRNGANSGAQDDDGRTPLHYAAKIGAEDVCKFLMAKKVGVFTDIHGRTPLHIAAAEGHLSCCQILLNEVTRWQIDVRDRDGLTPLAVAFRNTWDDVFIFLLQRAQHRHSKESERRTLRRNHSFETSSLFGVRESLKSAIKEGRSKAVEGIIRSDYWREAMEPCASGSSNFRLLVIHYPDLAKIVLDNCVLSRNSSTIFLFYYFDDTFTMHQSSSAASSSSSSSSTSTTSSFFLRQTSNLFSRTRDVLETWGVTTSTLERISTFVSRTSKGILRGILFPSDYGSVGSSGSGAEDADLPDHPCWIPFTSEGWLKDEARLKEDSEEAWRANHPLTLMAKHKRLDLLKHPLCKRLLSYKWDKYISRIFYCLFAVSSLFVLSLSSYATLAFDWDYVLQEFNLTREEVCSVERGSRCTVEDRKNVFRKGSSVCSLDKQNIRIILKNNVSLGFLEKFVWIMLFLNVFLELNKIHYLRRSRFEKSVQVACYSSAVIFLYDWTSCASETGVREDLQWSCGSLSVLLAWFDLILLLGTIPTFGVFLFMINDFLRFMLKFFIIVLLQVFAFSFAFHMLLRGRASFRNLPSATMRLLTMMVGDLGYDDLFNNADSPLPYPAVSNLLLICFLILMVVGVINVLTSFPQEEMERAKAQTELVKLSRQLSAALEMDSKFPHLRKRYAVGWLADEALKEDEADGGRRKEREEGGCEGDVDPQRDLPPAMELLLNKILNEINVLNENLEDRRFMGRLTKVRSVSFDKGKREKEG